VQIWWALLCSVIHWFIYETLATAAFNIAESDAPAGFSLDSFLRAVVFVKQLGEEFQQVGPDGNGLIWIKCDKFMEMALHLL
jgi:hypothetical protein